MTNSIGSKLRSSQLRDPNTDTFEVRIRWLSKHVKAIRGISDEV